MIPLLNEDLHTEIISQCNSLRDAWALLQTSPDLYFCESFWKCAVLVHLDPAMDLDISSIAFEDLRRAVVETVLFREDIPFPPPKPRFISTQSIELPGWKHEQGKILCLLPRPGFLITYDECLKRGNDQFRLVNTNSGTVTHISTVVVGTWVYDLTRVFVAEIQRDLFSVIFCMLSYSRAPSYWIVDLWVDLRDPQSVKMHAKADFQISKGHPTACLEAFGPRIFVAFVATSGDNAPVPTTLSFHDSSMKNRGLEVHAMFAAANLIHIIFLETTSSSHRRFWHASTPQIPKNDSRTLIVRPIHVPSALHFDLHSIRVFPDRSHGIYVLLSSETDDDGCVYQLRTSPEGILKLKAPGMEYSLLRCSYTGSTHLQLLPDGIRALVLSSGVYDETEDENLDEVEVPRISLISFDLRTQRVHVEDLEMPAETGLEDIFSTYGLNSLLFTYDVRSRTLSFRVPSEPKIVVWKYK